ncbi:hypothetical protein QZH41_009228, partial [Actinostola sp. cb2023]
AECSETKEAFSCQCPQGVTGKRCEIIREKEELRKIELSVRFVSLNWSDALADQSSTAHKRVSYTIAKSLRVLFHEDDTFVGVQVRRLLSGSVIAEFDLYMKDNASLVPAKSLQDAVAQGSIGGLPVDPNYLNIRQVTCSQPLGMENGRIEDDQVTVSSESKTHEAGKGRLNGKAWHAQELGPNEYLQIRFHTNVNITAIATRGDGDSGFVKSYTLSYSNDGDVWRTFLDAADASKTKIYRANNDTSSVVKEILPQPITLVKYIRVIPMSWEKTIGMRIELYGCISNPVLQPDALPTIAQPSHTEKKPVVTDPDVQGVDAKKDEYAWGKYLGITFGLVMVLVFVVSCFVWRRTTKKKRQKDDAPLVLTRFQDGSYRDIERNDDEDDDAV